ncbi:MAG: MSMEG_4193 family putative phosphomutase [Nocardioides sp.]|uniref:MSMEG_4193 family putative phosphomutase n=1 Tax=Nocardioides sp. TaxID=35761 RepID=UPI003F0017F5
MATVVLVRHGRTTANTSGILAGRTEGVGLDDTGRTQVHDTAARLSAVPLVRALSSPLERCRATAEAVLAAQAHPAAAEQHEGLNECDYGAWQGRSIAELSKEALWKVVLRHPSAAVFPGGESLREMQHRAVQAVRRTDAAVAEEHGKDAVWLAVSHGDVIKAVLADALGLHLDQFQRLHVDPASVSVVRYTDDRPYVLGVNTHAGDLGWLAAAPHGSSGSSGPVVGGGAGPGASPSTT